MENSISLINASFIASKLGFSYSIKKKDDFIQLDEFKSGNGEKLNKSEKAQVTSLNNELQSYDAGKSKAFYDFLEKSAFTIKLGISDKLFADSTKSIKVSGYVDINNKVIYDAVGNVTGTLKLYSSSEKNLGRGTGEDGGIEVKNYLAVNKEDDYVGKVMFSHEWGYQGSTYLDIFIFIESNKSMDKTGKGVHQWGHLGSWDIAYKAEAITKSDNTSILNLLKKKRLLTDNIKKALGSKKEDVISYSPTFYVLSEKLSK
jgi:hypothetical protein